MVSVLINNLIAFAMSIPTNMVILVIVCLIMKVCGKSIRDCIKLILAYLLIGLLLGIFGITMPNFIDIGNWIVNTVKSLW